MNGDGLWTTIPLEHHDMVAVCLSAGARDDRVGESVWLVLLDPRCKFPVVAGTLVALC
jgi:hypothetical protein